MAEGIQASLHQVQDRIGAAVAARKTVGKVPLLVAVSKTKPVELILDAYAAGQRHFGENYVQELHQKSNDPRIHSLCPDIRWHFIGHLQSNKSNKVAVIPNLWSVETIDTTKLASALSSAVSKSNTGRILNVMLEVNTSRESNKHGFTPEAVVEAASFLVEKCPALKLTGLMTIGATEHSALRPNPDFIVSEDNVTETGH